MIRESTLIFKPVFDINLHTQILVATSRRPFYEQESRNKSVTRSAPTGDGTKGVAIKPTDLHLPCLGCRAHLSFCGGVIQEYLQAWERGMPETVAALCNSLYVDD